MATRDEDFLAIAAEITASRQVFGNLYDSLIEPHIPRAQKFIALSKLREFNLRADKPDDPSLTDERKKLVADFAEALRQASDFGVLAELVAKHWSRLFSKEAVEKLGVAEGPLSVSLQSVINVKDVFHQALPITMGRMSALLRCCRITIAQQFEEPVKGSGFLIGPHLVLTNWHVVKVVLDQGNEAKDSHRRMKVEFDVLQREDGTINKNGIKQYQPVEKWLVDMSPAHPNETGGGGAPQNGFWPQNPEDLAQNLDFAIIELDGTPGYERGWYDLNDVRWPGDALALDLFQFPLGKPLVCNSGNFKAPTGFHDGQKPPRILHTVNAEKGSSGGLCLSQQGSKPMALHQAGYVFAAGHDAAGNPINNIINGAIPLPLIAQAAGVKVGDKISSAPRIKRITTDREPILGRAKLQAFIDEAIRGSARILIILTGTKAGLLAGKLGKSFSVRILRALLPSEHLAFEISAARLTNDAFTAAREILEKVTRDLPPSILKAPSGLTTSEADSAVLLAQTTVEELGKVAEGGVLWLVFDDLDRNTILPGSTTSTYLTALCDRASSDQRLRIVLIGPAVLPPAGTGPLARQETILDHVSTTELESWLAAEFGARMPILPELTGILVGIVSSMAQDRAKDPVIGPTQAFADVLSKYWLSSLRKAS